MCRSEWAKAGVRRLHNLLSDAMLLVEAPDTIVQVNHAAESLTGYAVDALEGLKLPQLDSAWEREHAWVRGDAAHTYAAHWRRASGGSVAVAVTVQRLGANLLALVARARSDAHVPLLESDALMHDLPSDIPDFVTVIDRQLNVLFTNRSATAGVAANAVIGTPVLTFVRPEHREMVQTRLLGVLESGRADLYEVAVNRPDGSTSNNLSRLTPVFKDGIVVGVTIASSDLDARRAAAHERELRLERLREQQKLELLGRMVSGIAHEINNPLTYILSNLALAREQISQGQPPLFNELLGEAVEGAERIRAVVRSVSLLGRGKDEPNRPIDLKAAVTEAVAIAKHQQGFVAVVNVDVAQGLIASGHPRKLGQVLLNLLLNAQHAIPEDEPNPLLRVTAVRDGEQLYVRVSDNGIGIPPELRERVFEPYFTTKEVGKGTGLGLFISEALMRQMGGKVRLLPQASPGTTVELNLPVGAAEELVGTGPRSEAPLASLEILIVDDQREILRSVARMLRGHRVTTAESGAAALVALQEQHFDLLLCDLMMPDLDGPAVYRAAVKADSRYAHRFIAMTGGIFNGPIEAFLRATPVHKLDKPFTREELLSALRQTQRELPSR